MLVKRPWAFWRRVQYGSGFVASLLLIVGAGYLVFGQTPPSCFDQVQNGSERGVDCGGNCVRICNADVLPPEILWVESFEIAPGQYNATAYVENLNDIASVERLTYRFELLQNDRVVATRAGETVFPPDSIYPFFEGRIDTNGEAVTDTRLIIDPISVWQPASFGRQQFRISDVVLSGADARPRLDAIIENTELVPATDVEVVATLFNDAGQPLTTSETFLAEIPPRSQENIVFTWPNSIARTVRTCAIPSDVVIAIDVSGSMNNDGGVPPQPISDTTSAAARFVERLGEPDQAALVTFATEAELAVPFTTDKERVASTISQLSISPAEETGFTNTVAALERIRAEFESERENENARRAAILLTDGLPTGSEETDSLIVEAVSVANEIDASGAVLYTIGLGENVDRAFVNDLASSESQAFIAPSRQDLDAIYEEITSALCESGTARIDVIAKTGANFTPLGSTF